MADVIITFRIMPESPETNLEEIEKKANELIKNFDGEVGKVDKQPFAFGLTAINMIFVMDENKGSTEDLEKQIAEIDEVSSIEVTDVRRAIG